MKFTEDELRAAAVEVRRYMLSQLPDEDSCQHCFSEQFEQDMEALRRKVRANQITQKQAFWGWPYYARRGIAAVLLCFVLACFTMPETVLAGYRYLIEVIETVWDEYTEFRYHSDASADTEFQPLELQYLPEGMEEVRREERAGKLNIVCADKEKYFILNQELVQKEFDKTFGIDTENTKREIIKVKDDDVYLIIKEARVQYVWVHGYYQINGRTNVSLGELEKILNGIMFRED